MRHRRWRLRGVPHRLRTELSRVVGGLLLRYMFERLASDLSRRVARMRTAVPDELWRLDALRLPVTRGSDAMQRSAVRPIPSDVRQVGRRLPLLTCQLQDVPWGNAE